MNIVFVVTKIGRGGAQRVSTILAGYLLEQGHQVSILCYEGNGTYPVKEGIQVYKLPYSKNVLWKHIWRIGSFTSYCRRNKVDLVIALFRGYDYTWLYRTLFPSRLILSQRNDPKAEYDKDFLARIACKFFFRGADKIVFQTEEEKEYFSEAIKKKGHVIPNPIMENLPAPYRGERRKLIVNFCRLEPQKNLKLLIDAFREVNLEEPGYHLKIYGNGSQREELAAYIKKRRLEGIAEVIPFSSNIHEEIKDAAMFVSSSDFEGISNSMLEAMALGIPCICTDCPAGGARMVIENGKNGILTPVGELPPLKTAMLSLIRDPEKARNIGSEAEKVRDTYSVEKICREWEKVINSIR